MAISENAIEELFFKYEEGLNKAFSHLKSELSSVRAGRANPHILDKILVDYYGTPTPINQIANVTVQDARMLVISCWDTNAVKETVKAISAADIGISPSDDGKIIRIVFPSLTEERRRDIVKTIKKLAEDSKIACRNERREIMEVLKKYKKDSDITEDDIVSYEKEVQKILDSYINKIDNSINEKEKEVMQV